MKNIRIYQPGNYQTDDIIHLDKSASNHLIRVLRLKNNQSFTLFNGEGGEYSALLEITGKSASARVQQFNSLSSESTLNIHLLQAISKGDRMDLVMQKSVELGVSKITPVISERTVVNLKADRLEKKLQHWQSIVISACEQSGRNIVPRVSAAIKLSQALQIDNDVTKLLLDPLSSINLQSIKPQTNNLTLLIGPEGGLTAEEIEQAKTHNYTGVQLGPRILRTETAALAAITSAQLLWGDLA